jgi:hypothetical protein
MGLQHPIDQEIRAWLKTHVDNEADLSAKVGHPGSWLHKYINGNGKATIDDLVRIAGTLFGLNLPALNETEQKLLKACRGLEPADLTDVVAFAEHRAKLAAQREKLTGSSAPAARRPPATGSTARSKR